MGQVNTLPFAVIVFGGDHLIASRNIAKVKKPIRIDQGTIPRAWVRIAGDTGSGDRM
jgi:hypothetical protein